MKIYIYLLLLIFSVLLSCKTIQYVPVETVRTEYIHGRDSIYQHDSIYLESSILSDTIVLTKEIYRLKEVYHNDTIVKQDSIPIIVEVEKQITTNRLFWWQHFLCVSGAIFTIIGIWYMIFRFVKLK